MGDLTVLRECVYQKMSKKFAQFNQSLYLCSNMILFS